MIYHLLSINPKNPGGELLHFLIDPCFFCNIGLPSLVPASSDTNPRNDIPPPFD